MGRIIASSTSTVRNGIRTRVKSTRYVNIIKIVIVVVKRIEIVIFRRLEGLFEIEVRVGIRSITTKGSRYISG